MRPQGRRKAFAFPEVLCLLLLLLPSVLAVPSALGIDLGTEFIKAVLVKPGIPLDIVLAKDSKRKEPAVIAFKPGNVPATSSTQDFPERLWGSDAVAIQARFPGDVYANLKPLLGVAGSQSPLVQSYQQCYPSINVRATEDRQTVCMKSETFNNEEQPFTVEELLGMQLQNVKANAEAMAGHGTTVRDAVITIPAYFTAAEKRAVEDAAEFAGLKVLAMTSDGLAVGLNYATSRTFPVVTDGAKPEYHMVFDMGAGSTTATILRFQGRQVKDIGKFNKTIQEVQVVGAGWDRTLGGDALNSLILNDLIENLAEHKQMKAEGTTVEDIKKHGRTMAKLRKEVQRMRQVLSANTETQASFEGLYHSDLIFKYKIARAHFEKLASDLEARVKGPILQALDMAKLDLNEIDSVILHGGAQRTPFVQKALEAAVGSAEKLKTNVNSDEAAAFGAAFKAAGLVPGFKVKEIRTSDAAIFPASMSYSVDGREKHQLLFGANSLAAKEKQVPFKFTEDFSFSFSQQVPDGTGGSRAIQISTVSTKNLTQAVKELKDKHDCEPSGISTQFSVNLSPITGLPEATRGSVSCEALVEQKKAGVMDGVKGMFGFGKKDDQVVLEEPNPDSSSAETDSASSTESSAESQATQTKDEKPKEPEKKVQVVYVGLSTEETGPLSISAAEKRRIKERMKAFDESDKNRKLREEALNVLEGYTYKIREILEDEAFIAVSTKKARDEIEKKASEAGEWIYGDGAGAKLQDFKDRLKALQGLVNPVMSRKEEAAQRPEKINQLRDSLNQTKVMIDGLFKDHEEKKIALASASSAALESAASEAAEAAASPSTTESSSIDELDALDDDTSAETSSTSSTETAMGEEGLGVDELVFTDEEIIEYQKRYQNIHKWFEEKVAAQEKLKPTDTPAVLVSELTKKSEDAQKLVVDVITQQMGSFGTKGKKGKGSKKDKTKKSRKPKKTSSATDKESTATVSSEEPSATDESAEQVQGHDEL